MQASIGLPGWQEQQHLLIHIIAPYLCARCATHASVVAAGNDAPSKLKQGSEPTMLSKQTLRARHPRTGRGHPASAMSIPAHKYGPTTTSAHIMSVVQSSLSSLRVSSSSYTSEPSHKCQGTMQASVKDSIHSWAHSWAAVTPLEASGLQPYCRLKSFLLLDC